MNTQKTLKHILSILLFVLILLFLITKVIEYDVWLHLSSGKYILDNFRVPRLDPFSYTASHRGYVDSHWLYQVILYLSYNVMGFIGIFLYQLLVIGGIFYILFRLGKNSNFYITTGCILLILIISNERFLYRPEMFSYLFAVLFVFILDKYAQENKKNLLFVLPILQIFWTNTHGFFIFGPIIIGCYFVGEVLQNKKVEKQILLPVLLCVFACFINPYGYKLTAYPFLLLTEIGSKASPYMKSVSALTPVLFIEKGNYRTAAYFILAVISFAGFFVSRKFNFSRFFVYLIFFYISWATVRNTVFFAFVASLITIINFCEMKDLKLAINLKIQQMAEIVYTILFIIISIVISVGIITNRYYRQERTTQQFGLGKVDVLFPTGAIEFIKKNNIGGNIFNDSLFGGYFLWNCYPERKVFINGKWEVYGEEFLAEYKSVIDNPNAYWQKIADKYKIDYVLLHPLSPHSKNLIKHLYKNKNWKLAYFDEGGIVFVGSDCKIEPIIKKLYPGNYSKPNKILALLSYANFFFFTEQYQKSQSYYAAVLKLDPDFPETYTNLAASFVAQGKFRDAEMCYRMAIRKSKKYAEPFYGLATLYLKKGDYNASVENLNFALKRKPIFSEAQFMLCYIYLKTGNYNGAIEICRGMISRTSDDETIYNMLGTAYFQKGNLKEALHQFEKAISINLEYNEAKRNYQACLDKMNEGREK